MAKKSKYISQYTGPEIDRGITKANNTYGGSYYDTANNTMLYFNTKEDLQEWISTGDSNLILDSTVMNFTNTIYQVKIDNLMGSKNLYFTTKEDKAEITVSFSTQKKGITESSWQDVIEDYNVSIYIDKGTTGSFTPYILDQFVMSGHTYTFDVKKVLATGSNRVRIIATGTESGEQTQGSEMFIVNLTSMYLSPSNFTWYKPFIEGETFALGGMNIGGNLNKVLKVRVSKEGYERLYEVNIGSNIYTTTAYVFNGLEFPSGGTGVYNVEIWLDANGLESDHLSYNIICVSQADKFTAQLVAIGDPAKTVYNFSDNKLFEYCVYNGGTATATPHIKVAYVVNTNPTIIIDEDLVDVATASPLTYTASLEIEMEDESAALQLETLMTYGNEQMFVFPVDNSKSYPATTGAVFYMNPSARNNAQSNREKVINSITGAEIDAVFTRMAWTDGTDGWTTDDEGRKCLRLPAGCTMEMDYSPLASVSQKTIELVYKAKNAADYDEPIFSICSDVNDPQFRGIVIRPKNILVHSRDLNVNDSLQDYNTTDEETLHVLITIIPNYKTNYGNLLQIYCNGDKVRSFSFETADRWDTPAKVKFGSMTADTYWYKFRDYNRGFETSDAAKNVTNAQPNTKAKEEMKARLEAPLDDSYNVSYDECVKNGLNTMVVEIIGQDQTVPSIANPSAKTCNTWIKINNPIDGELDEDFARLFSGEIIEGETIEGQGTTAMTYARWNFRWKLSSKYNKRRITAKKNFASSMHSHKMGATRLFNDLNRAIVGPNDADSRVAVYQYPVYGFQKILVDGTTDQYLYEFIGLYTIGPDKGDKATFGFDGEYESTLIHLEGTDHTPKGVGFDYPYEELGYSGSAEALGAVNATSAVVAAWECGAAGDYDPKDEPTETKAMLDAEFRPAYDVAELNSTYILGVTETLAEMNANISTWQAKKDAEGRSYADLQFFTDGVYDLYFYNTRTQKYEARGINMLTDLGVSVDGLSLDEKTELFKAKRRERFMANWETYWHKDDAIFHYAFVLLFGATDNFKKNTYPYKFKLIAEGGVYRWRQDDLDTLFDINNQGLAAKIYSILVGDKTETGSGSIYRGDTSAFWTLIKECFPAEIKAMVHAILDKMVELSPYGNNTLEKLVGCVRYYFWDKAQAYFPASAYSKDAEWTYEDTWAAGLYKEVNPLQQSLGGHKEAEIDWVTMRMLFCAMYFNYGPFGAVNDSFSDTSTGQIAYGGAGAKTYLITMACDGNPTILRGQSELVTFGDRVKAGETIELTVPDSSGADTRIYIQGVDWMEDIGDLSDLQVSADNPQLSVTSKRLQSVKIGDEDASKVTTNVQALNFGACPSMMIVDARNAKSLTGTIDLSKMPRLMEAYFGGTGVKAVNVPNGSKIAVLELGEETTQISLMNLKFMQSGKVQKFVPNFEKGLFYYTNQGVGETCPLQVGSDVNFACCLFNCKKYATVTITGNGGNNARLWCFLDSNNVILSVAEGGAVANNLELEVPEGAAKLVCGFNASTNPNYSVVAKTKSIKGFSYTSLPKLEFLRIENCSQLNPFTMLKSIYNTEGNVIRDIRIIGFDVDGDASDVTMIANLANDVDKDGNPHVYNGIDAEGKPMDNSHPVIEGRLRINGNIYEEDYEALKAVFSNLAMEFLGFYVSFKDPEVLRVLLEKITTDDGIGLTTEDVEKVTNISTWFKGNTSIETFDEFERFIGVKTLNDSALSGCSALKSIRLPKTITTIGRSAFTNTPAEMVIDLPNLTNIANDSAWDGAFYNTGVTEIKNLGKITVLRESWDTNNRYGIFADCKKLTKVNLPDSLVTLGNVSFLGCTSLSEINLDKVETFNPCVFYGCTALSINNLTLPSAKSIGRGVFYNVPLTGELRLPALTTFGGLATSYGAFQKTQISKVLDLGSITTFPDGYNSNCGTFNSVSTLEEVVLPETLTTIGVYTFYNCKALTRCNIPSSVTNIKSYAFGNCTALEFDELRTPNLVTLGGNAFSGVTIKKWLDMGKITSLTLAGAVKTALEEIVIPSSVTTIGAGAVNNYTNCVIEDLNVPNLTSIGTGAFRNSKLKRITSLGSVTSFPVASGGLGEAFESCKELTYVSQDVLNKITYLSYAFRGCTNLVIEELRLPSLSGTATGAFFGCTIKKVLDLGQITALFSADSLGTEPPFGTAVEEYVVPSTVTSIGRYAFRGVPNLKFIKMLPVTPPTLHSLAFYGDTSNCPIYVPDESVEAYKTATNWSSFASRIYPMSVYEGALALRPNDVVVHGINTMQLKTTVQSYDVTPKYTVNDSSIASVGASGLITFAKEGTVEVTATFAEKSESKRYKYLVQRGGTVMAAHYVTRTGVVASTNPNTTLVKEIECVGGNVIKWGTQVGRVDRLCQYDENKEFISFHEVAGNITLNQNAKYLTFCVTNATTIEGAYIQDAETGNYLWKGTSVE